jgi:hypothetical protein
MPEGRESKFDISFASANGLLIGFALVPWYERRTYSAVMDILEDRDKHPPTFDEWQEVAQAKELAIQGQGGEVHRVPIDLVKFSEWCKNEGCDRNGESVTDFARECYRISNIRISGD